MSRSFKKTPVFGNCGNRRRASEKEDKRLANRHFRHWANQEVREWGEDVELPLLREASNVWDFKRDGKHYQQNYKSRDMRK